MAAFGSSRDSDVDKLRNRLNMLEGEISRLRQEIKALNTKFESTKIPMEIVNPASTAQPLSAQPHAQRTTPALTPEPEKLVHNFYLSTPNSDGSFNNSSASPTYKEGASIYKFQNTQSNQAKFKVDERESSVRLAMRFPDKNIDPVCDALNKFDPNPKKILTDEPGIAELIGDKWKVITKARIRYES